MYLTREIVLLSSKEKSILGLNKIHNHLFLIKDEMAEIPTQEYQNLYVLSDEPINAMDWVLYTNPKTKIVSAVRVKTIKNKKFDYERGTMETLFVSTKHAKKIISTTDRFILKSNVSHSHIPYIFIIRYVKSYNEGKQITHVNIKYDSSCLNWNTEVCDTVCEGCADLFVDSLNRISIEPAEDPITDKDYVQQLEGMVCFLSRCYEKAKSVYFDEHMKTSSISNPNRRNLTPEEQRQWQSFPLIQGLPVQRLVHNLSKLDKPMPTNTKEFYSKFLENKS